MISLTPGLGGLGDIEDWWTEPIVFQKFAVWTLLWEILGLGAGSMPLSFRFVPPIGGPLYWLRRGTMRLPPWPRQGPTHGGLAPDACSTSSSTPGCSPRASPCSPPRARTPRAPRQGACRRRASPSCSASSCCSGCATRSPSSAPAPRSTRRCSLVGLFPVDQWIVAWQFIFVFIWWGAASSKLNRHFPFVVSTMISNAPWNRFEAASSAGSGATTRRTCGRRGSPRRSPTSARCRSSSGRCCC